MADAGPSAVRLPAARLLDSWQQGHYDGFCGLYALINAVRLLLVPDRSLAEADGEALFAAGIRVMDAQGRLSAFARHGLPLRLWPALTAAVVGEAGELSGVAVVAERPLRRAGPVSIDDVVSLVTAALRAGSPVVVLLRGALNHYSVVSGITRKRLELFDSYGHAQVPLAACGVAGSSTTARHRLHTDALTVLRAEYPVTVALPKGPISLATFRTIEHAVRDAGHGDAIARSEAAGPPGSARAFAQEVIYVVVNGGMSNSVAAPIVATVMATLRSGKSASTVYGHPGKAAAIDRIWADRKALFAAYLAADDRLAFSETIPWIGPVTRYHLAKIFGEPFAKPDVHLNRLARAERTTAQALCERLAVKSGYRAGTVDLILWQACADGIVDSAAKRR